MKQNTLDKWIQVVYVESRVNKYFVFENLRPTSDYSTLHNHRMQAGQMVTLQQQVTKDKVYIIIQTGLLHF